VVVGQDQGELFEQAAFFRGLDVFLERQIALALGQLEQLVQQAEQLAIAVLVVLRPL